MISIIQNSTYRAQRFFGLLAAIALVALSLGFGATAPAHAQTAITVNNGDMAYVQDNGTCTLTVISTSYALTAGHCGQEGKRVSAYGVDIGEITFNGLQRGTGYDFAKIQLKPGVSTAPQAADFSYSPRKGDVISRSNYWSDPITGSVSDPALRSVTAAFDDTTYRVRVWTAALESYEGNSGSPIYYRGKVVAILKGGPIGNYQVTTVTPLSEMRAYL